MNKGKGKKLGIGSASNSLLGFLRCEPKSTHYLELSQALSFYNKLWRILLHYLEPSSEGNEDGNE
jgi:hypothetical protein